MNILNEIRKSQQKLTTNWFMHEKSWYKFSNGELYTQDKTKSGPESITEITDKHIYQNIQLAYASKQ